MRSCKHFIPFLPIAVGIPLTFFPAITMWFRYAASLTIPPYALTKGDYSVYALYERSKIIGIFLATYLLAEFAVKLWITSTPGSHRE